MECSLCEGTGQIWQYAPGPNGPYEKWDDCPDCDGTGYLETEEEEC